MQRYQNQVPDLVLLTTYRTMRSTTPTDIALGSLGIIDASIPVMAVEL